MHTWKDRVQHIFYLHYRMLTSIIFIIGGAIALSMVFLFLLTSAPVENVQDQGSDVVTNTKGLERVSTWINKKQDDSKVNISIPSTSFARPSVAP